jgi:hypothetical protein
MNIVADNESLRVTGMDHPGASNCDAFEEPFKTACAQLLLRLLHLNEDFEIAP